MAPRLDLYAIIALDFTVASVRDRNGRTALVEVVQQSGRIERLFREPCVS
jgi:hypothetical protein